jgi:UMF1 family MFS transporter
LGRRPRCAPEETKDGHDALITMAPPGPPLHTTPHHPTSPRNQILVWSLFDFANTSFSVLIVAVGYSLYFKDVVVGGAGRGDFFWGLIVSISMLLTALIAPVLGAASDYAHSRKLYLLGFTLMSVGCTALLYFVGPGMIALGAVLFIVANIGFEGGIVFYDAFLPLLTTKERYGRISGYGFAMGYVGSLASLLIAMPLYADGFVTDNLHNIRLSFLIAAGMFLVFSMPLFFFLRDRERTVSKQGSYMKEGFDRVLRTLSHLRSYRRVALFLVAFFLYNDGILTVISFASIFAQQSLNFSLKEILVLFAVVQASAIIGSLIFGFMTDKIGPKRTIIVSLLCWIGVVVGAYLVTSKPWFYGIGVVAGSCMGGAQSASRSLMAMLTPPDREAEFFGFYDGFCGKASAVIGTFVFGALSWATGSQRIAVLSVGLFFVIGLSVLHFVQDPSVKPEQHQA